MKRKAIVLLSGGLDSTLAAKMMLDMGIEIIGINFVMPFGFEETDGLAVNSLAARSAEQLGIELKTIYLGIEYMEMVRNPKHGYGKAVNPCIDCHAYFLRKAGEFMRESGADFLVTGEVLGQRPMSQRRDSMLLVEQESGMHGLILRPLSAQHFEPTIPEKEGWVDRNRLLAIKGRSRHEQFKLAEEAGVKDYPAPAGGCLLTELSFVAKMRDIFSHSDQLVLRDFRLLKTGRHFRIGERTKLIVARDANDNARLQKERATNETVLHWIDGKSPLGIITGKQCAEHPQLAARILLRFTKAAPGDVCRVSVEYNGENRIMAVSNDLDDRTLKELRIE